MKPAGSEQLYPVTGSAPHMDEATDERTNAQGRWNWRRDTFKGYAHASARENQLLSTDWGALSSIDVQAIVELISKRLTQPIAINEDQAILGILGALTTGRKFDDWLTYILCPAESEVSHPRAVF